MDQVTETQLLLYVNTPILNPNTPFPLFPTVARRVTKAKLVLHVNTPLYPLCVLLSVDTDVIATHLAHRPPSLREDARSPPSTPSPLPLAVGTPSGGGGRPEEKRKREKEAKREGGKKHKKEKKEKKKEKKVP